MSVEHHPHDTNFKHNFGNKKVARDFLAHHLPQMVLDQIDLSTLEIESPEFIGSKHRGKRSADIVYSVKTKCGKCIYALVHLEAEGKHTKDMGIRVFEYHAGIARSHYRKEGSGKIPLILTFVLYYGKETWTSPTSIADMFERNKGAISSALAKRQALPLFFTYTFTTSREAPPQLTTQ